MSIRFSQFLTPIAIGSLLLGTFEPPQTWGDQPESLSSTTVSTNDSSPEVQRAYEQLLAAVNANDFEGFSEAAEDLRKLGAASVAVPALLDLVEQNEEFRWTAAFAIDEFGSDAKLGLPKLIALLKHSEASAREAALYVLDNLGSDAGAAIPSLVAAQDDPSASVRKRAISALRSIGSEAIPYLIAALKHRDPFVRACAAHELDYSDSKEDEVQEALKLALEDSDLSVRVTAAEALCDWEESLEAAVPILAEGIEQEDEDLRRSAIRALEDLGPKANAVRPVLLQAILDWNDAGRWGVDALKAMDPDAVEEDIVFFGKAFESENRTIRRRAIAALGRYKIAYAVPFLERALKDSDSAIRVYAAESFYHLGPQAVPAVPALISALGDSTEHETLGLYRWRGDVYSVSELASGALANIAEDDPDRTVLALAKALRSDETEVRLMAAKALRRIPNSNAAVPALAEVLEDSHVEVAIAAARALKRIGADAKPALPSLLKRLNDEDPVLRFEVCDAIWKLSPDDHEMLISPLVNLLGVSDIESDDPPYSEIRDEAAYLLICIGEPTVPALIEALTSENAKVRSPAAWILGRCGTASLSALSILVATLDDPLPEVRSQAAEAVGQYGPEAKRATLPLRRLLNDPDESVARKSAEALGKIGPEARAAVPILIDKLSDMRGNVESGWGGPSRFPLRYYAAEALGKMGPEAAPATAALIEKFQDEDEYVRRASATALAKIGSAAIDPLLHALQSSNLHVRAAACEAMRLLAPKSQHAVEALTECLSDTYADVRYLSAQALGTIGPPAKSAIPSLINRLNDAAEHHEFVGCMGFTVRVRDDATEALVQIGNAAIPLLVKTLDHEDIWAQLKAAEALSHLDPRNTTAVPLLAELVTHEDWDIYESAASTLARIGPPAKAAIPALKATFGKDEIRDHEIAIALLRIDPSDDVVLQSLLSDLKSEYFESVVVTVAQVGRPAKAAIPVIAKRLKEASESEDEEEFDDIQLDAFDALGKLGPESLPHLIEYLSHNDSFVQDLACGAILDIGPEAKAAVPFLVPLVGDGFCYEANRALGTFGTDAEIAVPALIEDLRDGSYSAADALGKIGSASVPSLIEILDHENYRVRALAVEALGEIGEEAKASVPSLIEILGDSRMKVRANAAEALGKIGEDIDRTVPALVAVLNDEYLAVRRSAAEALGRLGQDAKPAIPALRKASRDEFQAVREAAVLSLAKIEEGKVANDPSRSEM